MKIISKYEFIFNIILIIIIISVISITLNLTSHKEPVVNVSPQFMKLLNSYEGIDNKHYSVNEQNEKCVYSFEVGDNAVTFGYGNAYQSEFHGITKINRITGKDYEEGDCILVEDLNTLQMVEIEKREKELTILSMEHDVYFTQQQLDGLMLLFYLNESSIQEDEFWDLVKSKDFNEQQYVDYFTDYYSHFKQYDKFKNGWNKRIVDSAQIYFNNEYERNL